MKSVILRAMQHVCTCGYVDVCACVCVCVCVCVCMCVFSRHYLICKSSCLFKRNSEYLINYLSYSEVRVFLSTPENFKRKYTVSYLQEQTYTEMTYFRKPYFPKKKKNFFDICVSPGNFRDVLFFFVLEFSEYHMCEREYS